MDSSDELRAVVASFLKVDVATLTPDFDLRQKLQNSVARGGLDAVIRRRLNKTCPEVYTVRTFGQLAAAVLGDSHSNGTGEGTGQFDQAVNGSIPDQSASLNSIQAMPAGVDCGVDVECPANLPVERDYWESDFYRAHFTPREIAYCVEQEDPRQHFAARWCAKEALKKCDPSLRSLEMHHLELAADEHGKPHLFRVSDAGTTLLPVAVSLSHSNQLALAFVVQLRGSSLISRPTAAQFATTGDNEQTPSETNALPQKKSWVKRLFGA
jgi:phosphopantetheine--protein transferase-like protein